MKKVINQKYFSLREKKGRAMTETLSVMLLLILLGAGCVGLAASTFNAYKRIYKSKSNSSELRVASSFIMAKIRQNDVSGCLDIKPDPISGKNALVIYENIEGTEYATWIFHYEGQLWEAIVLKDEAPEINMSQSIARLDTFNINFDRDGVGIRTEVGLEGYKPYENITKVRSN